MGDLTMEPKVRKLDGLIELRFGLITRERNGVETYSNVTATICHTEYMLLEHTQFILRTVRLSSSTVMTRD